MITSKLAGNRASGIRRRKWKQKEKEWESLWAPSAQKNGARDQSSEGNSLKKSGFCTFDNYIQLVFSSAKASGKSFCLVVGENENNTEIVVPIEKRHMVHLGLELIKASEWVEE